MPTYKVTKVFTVEAASKQEAVDRITNEPGELLDYVSVFIQPEAKSQSGWKASLKKQLAGK